MDRGFEVRKQEIGESDGVIVFDPSAFPKKGKQSVGVARQGRRKAAGVPKEIRFQTRHAQALEMLAEQGRWLPHAWSQAMTKWAKRPHFAGI